MKDPKILLVVTGWNCAKYAVACVESIHQQTYKNFEVVIVDDASTDGTAQYLHNTETGHNILKGYDFYRLPQNIGTVGAKDFGIRSRERDHDIIAFLDLDDRLTPDALQVVAKEYEDRDCWLTHGSYIDSNGLKLTDVYNPRIPKKVADEKLYRYSDWMFTPLRTVRRELYNKLHSVDLFLPGSKIYPDANMLYCLLEMCPHEKISFIEKPLYLYTVNNPLNVLTRFPNQNERDKELDFVKSLPPKKQLTGL